MSLVRRLEMIFGGPAREFPLTVTDAHELACALEDYIRATEAESLPAEQPGDEQIDAERLAHLRELKRRLYQHAGYDRLAQKEASV